MKSLLFLFLLPFYSSPPITYRTLTWGDFKGTPTNDHAASSCTGIVIEKDTAYAIFEPESSWTRTKSPEVLRHEQLHFVITQKWASNISRSLCYGTLYIGDYLREWGKEEERYDAETNHGTDTAAQRQWEEKIKL